MNEYFEKLRDPRWQKKRLEVMEKANWKCACCGDSGSTLHIHHGYYESGYDPWDYEDKTLHCLCSDCHTMAEWAKRDIHFEIAKWNPKNYGKLINLIHDSNPDGEK